MSTTAIRKWMRAHVEEFRDACNIIDCTSMVEAWDREESTGGATLDEHHPAWDVAVEIAHVAERREPVL